MSNTVDIRARLAAITPGPWRAFNYCEFEDDSIMPPDDAWWLDGPEFVSYDEFSLFKETDAAFIAHAPDDVRALLARVAELEAALRTIAESGDRPGKLDDLQYQRGYNAALASVRDIARAALGETP